MSLDLLIDNLTNPALLFFFLGIIAVQVKSDLEIPENSSKFISLYLIFSIGFKGGQELAHSTMNFQLSMIMVFGVLIALAIPFYVFMSIKKKVGTDNACAIAAAYGSVSAVTFITAISYLETQKIEYGGYMVAVMALMEAPSIIMGVLLLSVFGSNKETTMPMKSVVKHSLSNGSVLLIMGSLLIGFLASEKQAQGIAPFTTDIFKGFLAVFLLDKGIISGRKLAAFCKNGYFPFVFATIVPFMNGLAVSFLSSFVTSSHGDRLLFAILAASASYIAVPAAMKLAAPKANPGLYIPMALAVTFPFNITLGMPLYLMVARLI